MLDERIFHRTFVDERHEMHRRRVICADINRENDSPAFPQNFPALDIIRACSVNREKIASRISLSSRSLRGEMSVE